MSIKKDLWLNKRLTVITATEVAAMLNLNPYMSPQQLIHDKKNKIKPIIEDDRFLRAGQMLESGAIQFALKYDFGIHAGRFEEYTFFTKEFLGSTPDGFKQGLTENHDFLLKVENSSLFSEFSCTDVLLEYKTAGTAKLKTWLLSPPINYLLQCQTQLITTPGYSKVFLVLCLRNDTLPISIWKVEKDQDLQELIIKTSEKLKKSIETNVEYVIPNHVSILASDLAKKTSEFLCHGKGHKNDIYIHI